MSILYFSTKICDWFFFYATEIYNALGFFKVS